jgi:hypothetical protein
VTTPPPAVPSRTPFTVGTATPTVAPDNTIEDDTKKQNAPLRWRGSTFNWNHSATTTLLGVGRDNIGTEHEVYTWAFNLRPRYFVVDAPKDKVTVSADVGMEVEFTDSSRTTDRNELLFQDTFLGAAYTRILATPDKGEYRTIGTLFTRLRLPTSKFSYEQGQYLATTIGPALNQQIKILGNSASALNNVTIAASVSWNHLFASSYVPTNPDLKRPRQNASGTTMQSDVLSGYSMAMNTIVSVVSADLPIVEGLTLSTSFGHIATIKHQFDDDGACHAQTLTGCVNVPPDPNATLFQPTTLFRAGLTYGIKSYVDLSLGYENIAGQLGEDAQRRNMFYSPFAQFYVDITANIDAIYKGGSGTTGIPASRQVARR